LKLAIVTALWKRPQVSNLVLDWYANLEISGIDLVRIAVASPEDDTVWGNGFITHDLHTNGHFSSYNQWFWHSYPNLPLSDKFNYGVRMAGNHDPDAVMIVGSDNLISPEYFKELKYYWAYGYGYTAPSGTYFFNGHECRYVRSTVGCGAGRVLSKEILNKCNWQPYEAGADKYIETSMKNRIGAPDYMIDVSPESGRYVVDIKTKDNIHSYEKMAYNLTAQMVDVGKIYEAFPSLRAFSSTMTQSDAPIQ